jgi:hypothetical protein
MAPFGSAIKAWPSGQIMATPMITRAVVIRRFKVLDRLCRRQRRMCFEHVLLSQRSRAEYRLNSRSRSSGVSSGISGFGVCVSIAVV